jgi:hypothetical protein
MKTKKQKQEKLKEECRKINVEVIFWKKNEASFYIFNLPESEITGYYSGGKIIRFDFFCIYPWQQQKYNQIFNIIQQINEN